MGREARTGGGKELTAAVGTLEADYRGTGVKVQTRHCRINNSIFAQAAKERAESLQQAVDLAQKKLGMELQVCADMCAVICMDRCADKWHRHFLSACIWTRLLACVKACLWVMYVNVGTDIHIFTFHGRKTLKLPSL